MNPEMEDMSETQKEPETQDELTEGTNLEKPDEEVMSDVPDVQANAEQNPVKPESRKKRARGFKTQYTLVNICRFILAATFLFSAFTKANDPVGLTIKLGDYASALGLTQLPEYVLYTSGMLLMLVEAILGIYLLVGMRRRRRVAAASTIFMMVMTAVTFWIAIENPVSDCGCFGDAIMLSNGQTLIKNVILLAMAIFITIRYKMMFRLIHKNWSWLVTVPVVLAYVVFYTYCAYMLPVVDYLPFAEGTDLRKTVKTGDALDMRYKSTIIYKRGDETLELGLDDDDPDSTWTYVETKTVMLDNLTEEEAETEFYVIDSDGDDITDDIIQADGYTFLVIVPEISKASEACAGKFNSIYDYCNKYGYGFYFITMADEQQQERWRRNTGAKYPFCESEDRMLWQVVRDNPGLVLLKDGVVRRKWSQTSMPEFDYDKPIVLNQSEEIVKTKRINGNAVDFSK